MLKPQLPAIAVLFTTIVTPLATSHETFPAQVVGELDKAFSSMASGPHVVNAVALVDARNGHLSWTRAAGTANPRLGQPMTIDHQFRTASVTKTFTGVLVLQLIEEGKFELDTPLHQLLKPEHLPKGRSIADLHHLEGKRMGNEITVRHLLNHTSGLADYWFDKGTVGDWLDKSWLDVGLSEEFDGLPETFDPPTRLWTPDELVQFYFEIGLNRRAHFAPGDGFLYSDTNYLLLGMVIEQATDVSLSANYRKRILEPLGITQTYKEYREKPPKEGRLAHHFWFIRGKNLDVVEEQMASTGEWANGGQVTSVADLRTFIRGLFSGKLFRQPDTLDQMMSAATIDLSDPQKYFEHGESTYNLYTCGLKRWRVGSTVLWGHAGFWGIGMFYIPESDVCVILVSNQVATNVEDEMRRFVKSLQDSGFLE